MCRLILIISVIICYTFNDTDIIINLSSSQQPTPMPR